MKEAKDGMRKYECKLSKRLERECACYSRSGTAEPSNNNGPPGSLDLHIPPEIAEPYPDSPPPPAESCWPPNASHFEGCHSHKVPSHHTPYFDPWWPFFNTCEDFLLSEIILNFNLSHEQGERLIKFIKHCMSGKGTLMLSSMGDIQNAWDQVSLKLTPDAKKVFRCSGQSSTHIFDEPWTADAFWDTQSWIPDGGNLLAFILYVDKMKLSSFGTSKGYPVVTHCANLPTLIQNGNGFGGGHVVGWLPIVSEDPKDSKKPDFVNLKRTVWHTAFEHIIQSILELSKTGCWLECGDGIQRWIFPVVLILSADYEEQCMMSLICGSNSKRPCPICLVKGEELADISRTWPLRMAGDTQGVIQDGQNLQSTAKCKNMLSDYGICDVKHQQIDTQFNAVPRWSGLVHFQEVMKVTFTDSSKYEDLSRLVAFVAHNVIPSHDKAGWLLLCYLYLAFEAHTEHMIKSGQCELAKFAKCMKNWNFPKMHVLVHSFNDIEQKGASCNYNMKPNEKLHGPLKKSYLIQIDETEHQKNVDEDVDDPPELSSLLLDSDVVEAPCWLTKELPAHDIVVPSPIEFCLDDWITQYRSLRIIYESKALPHLLGPATGCTDI
ncbi:hypothetical protein BJV74DRAFT_799600 [Russula compacta]|nr:hypothetical protein BJV74DRAFT_799600 [Russula compacta]